MATGHQATPNIYNERFPASGAADQWGNTALPRGPEAQDAAAYGITGDVIKVSLDFGAGTETKNVVAPCTGRLVAAAAQTQTTTDGTNTITILVQNESNSSADLVPSALFDADPVMTSNTVTDLTLSTTAADLLVTEGDNIECAYTEGGTIAGWGMTLHFVSDK